MSWPRPTIPASAPPGRILISSASAKAAPCSISVRAARQVPGADAGTRYAVWGHSQGGQAALYAGLMARAYARELTLTGIAAAAPATDLRTLMMDDADTAGGRNLTAMTLWSWTRVFGVPIDNVVAPEAMGAVNRLAQECIEGPLDIFLRGMTGKMLATHFLTVKNLPDLEPWRTLLQRNTPAPLPRGIPLFLAQGVADEVVRPAVTRAYMARTCRNGARVRLLSISRRARFRRARQRRRRGRVDGGSVRGGAGAERLLEHDPEKWEPVFGKRSCSRNKPKRDELNQALSV